MVVEIKLVMKTNVSGCVCCSEQALSVEAIPERIVWKWPTEIQDCLHVLRQEESEPQQSDHGLTQTEGKLKIYFPKKKIKNKKIYIWKCFRLLKLLDAKDYLDYTCLESSLMILSFLSFYW